MRNAASEVIEVAPAVWFFGGGGGAALLMFIIRFVLKQYGGIGVDRRASQGEVAVHQSYKRLIENFEREITRLHSEINRMEEALRDCQTRHKSAEHQIAQLRHSLAKKGIL